MNATTNEKNIGIHRQVLRLKWRDAITRVILQNLKDQASRIRRNRWKIMIVRVIIQNNERKIKAERKRKREEEAEADKENVGWWWQ